MGIPCRWGCVESDPSQEEVPNITVSGAWETLPPVDAAQKSLCRSEKVCSPSALELLPMKLWIPSDVANVIQEHSSLGQGRVLCIISLPGRCCLWGSLSLSREYFWRESRTPLWKAPGTMGRVGKWSSSVWDDAFHHVQIRMRGMKYRLGWIEDVAENIPDWWLPKNLGRCELGEIGGLGLSNAAINRTANGESFDGEVVVNVRAANRQSRLLVQCSLVLGDSFGVVPILARLGNLCSSSSWLASKKTSRINLLFGGERVLARGVPGNRLIQTEVSINSMTSFAERFVVVVIAELNSFPARFSRFFFTEWTAPAGKAQIF